MYVIAYGDINMLAEENKIYGQILNDKLHWIFTKNELLEWNNEQCPAVEIQDLDPIPQVGWEYINGVFTAPIIVEITSNEVPSPL
jgi:hypothetical protein